MAPILRTSKMKRIISAGNREATVSDIPTDELEKVLKGEGWPAGHAKNLQSGWSKHTKLNRRTLQDFAAGAAQEEAEQGHK